MSDIYWHKSSINLQYGGVNHLVGVSGWNLSDSIISFTCVVMPRNELRLPTEDGEDNIIFALLVQY